MSELYRMVRNFRESLGPSRNRAFDELSKPLARRAFRIHQRLRGLEEELRTGASVSVRRHGMGLVVRVAHPEVRVRREAYLTVEEYELLCADPTLAALLRPFEVSPLDYQES